MPNLTPNQRQIGTLYCQFMEEIIVRDELIQNSLINFVPPVLGMKNMPEMKEIALTEFCYLQLRMICELIALGCLTAQGDIAGIKSKKVNKSRKADWIMNRLEELHPRFYPAAGMQIFDDKGKIKDRVKLATGFITKKELLELYHECGLILHRGSLKEVSSGKRPLINSGRITSWSNKIWNLLCHHEMDLIDPRRKIIALMKTSESDRPQFSFWRLGDDERFHFESAVTPA